MAAVDAPGGDVEMASSPKGPATTTATTQGTDIDDFDLPRTVINRIAKTCFPEGMALAKETRLALTKSATVFINYITGAAGDACKAQNKKTISVEHIYKALEESEFEGILEYVKEMVQSARFALAPCFGFYGCSC
jgi:DNA polymerase epsilon subunit 3